MKLCKCGKQIEESRLKQRYCINCHNKYMRMWRKSHKLTNEQRIKDNCRSYLSVYIKRGKIQKTPCIVCGSLNVEAHHKDYSKPLDVIFVCRKHHMLIHKTKDIL